MTAIARHRLQSRAAFLIPGVLAGVVLLPVEVVPQGVPVGSGLSLLGSDRVHDARYQILGGSEDPYPVMTFHGLTGRGIRIAVFDQGIDECHEDFTRLGIVELLDSASSVGKCESRRQPTRVYARRPERSVHGTLVASIAAGNGAWSWRAGLPAFAGRGHAPEAELADAPMLFERFNSSREAALQQYVSAFSDFPAPHLSNHSYAEGDSAYSWRSALVDSLIRGDVVIDQGLRIPPRLGVWAAGACDWQDGCGWRSVEVFAKNALVVGSVDAATSELSGFSPLGPTPDGRVKPDVVAPGCHDSGGDAPIAAAESYPPSGGLQLEWWTPYSGDCGTSLAAPAVAGVIALVMEVFEKRPLMGDRAGDLLPALYRGLIVHTARDLARVVVPPDSVTLTNAQAVGYHVGPDHATGYGLVHAPAAVERMRDARSWVEAAFDTGQAAVGDSALVASRDWGSDLPERGRHEWPIHVPRGTSALKVTLAWDDPAAEIRPDSPVASALVHDLDLMLVSEEGDSVLPWTLPPPVSGAAPTIARRSRDLLNNLEMVTVSEPTEGLWRAVVHGARQPQGPQTYALISSHPIQHLEVGADSLVCTMAPNVCIPDVDHARYEPDRTYWSVEPGSALPLDVVCPVPSCPNRGTQPYSLHVNNLPGRALVMLVTRSGVIKAMKPASRSVVFNSIDPYPDRALLLLAVPLDEAQSRQPISLHITLGPEQDGGSS